MTKTRLHRVGSDWSKYGIDICMHNAYIGWIDANNKKPTVLYCSSNFGQLYQLSLCGFAVKHKLIVVFIPRKGFEEPYFYFGDEDGQETLD